MSKFKTGDRVYGKYTNLEWKIVAASNQFYLLRNSENIEMPEEIKFA